MRCPLLRAGLALALALLVDNNARAEQVSFDYVWHPGALQAGEPGGVRLWTGPVPAVIYSGSALVGGAPTPLEEMAALGAHAPPGAGPLTLDTDFRLGLTFYEGDRQGDLEVVGRLRGTLGPLSSTMTLSFARPGSVRLGDHLYTVRINSVPVPPAPDRSDVVLRPEVTVSRAAQHMPEPSALALTGAAALTLLASRRLRRAGAR
jgi:hypothetical protein